MLDRVKAGMRGRRVQVKEEPFNTYANADKKHLLTKRTGEIRATVQDIYYEVLHDDGKLFGWKPSELIFLDEEESGNEP